MSAALLLGLALCAPAISRAADNPDALLPGFEVSGFDPLYHDDPNDWLGSLGLFGIEGITNQAFSPGALGLGKPWINGANASGVHLSGEAGGWQVSLLGVQNRGNEAMDLRNSFVARVTRELFDAASIGFIMTSGDPDSGVDARTVGMDVSYRTSGDVEATAWIQQTDSPLSTDGDDNAWGVRLRYPDKQHDVDLRHAHYGEAFNPALGQVGRRGIDDTRLRYRVNHDTNTFGDWLVSSTVHARGTRAIGDEEASERVSLSFLEAVNPSGDRLEGFVSSHHEVLVHEFDLAGHLPVLPGRYEYTRYGMNLSTSRFDRWVLGLQLARGDYLEGARTDWQVTGEWRATDWLRLDAVYAVNEHEQPSGAFTARTLSLKSEMTLLPGWSLAPAVRFNNVNEHLGLGARLQWRLVPGREFLLDWNRTVLRRLEDRLVAPLQDSVLRGSYRLRF